MKLWLSTLGLSFYLFGLVVFHMIFVYTYYFKEKISFFPKLSEWKEWGSKFSHISSKSTVWNFFRSSLGINCFESWKYKCETIKQVIKCSMNKLTVTHCDYQNHDSNFWPLAKERIEHIKNIYNYCIHTHT